MTVRSSPLLLPLRRFVTVRSAGRRSFALEPPPLPPEAACRRGKGADDTSRCCPGPCRA